MIEEASFVDENSFANFVRPSSENFSVYFNGDDAKNLENFWQREEAETVKQHAFIQDIDIDRVQEERDEQKFAGASPENTSFWSASGLHNSSLVAKKCSWMKDSNSVLSITSYFRSASAPIGSLGSSMRERPHFGHDLEPSSCNDDDDDASRDRTLSDAGCENAKCSIVCSSRLSDRTTDSTNSMSLSQLRRLIDELSTSCNATSLVDAILNAKRQLASKSSATCSSVSEAGDRKSSSSSTVVENVKAPVSGETKRHSAASEQGWKSVLEDMSNQLAGLRLKMQELENENASLSGQINGFECQVQRHKSRAEECEKELAYLKQTNRVLKKNLREKDRALYEVKETNKLLSNKLDKYRTSKGGIHFHKDDERC